ncbi:MAG: phosphatase PAP2 family protein [Actinomycetota bacterium]
MGSRHLPGDQWPARRSSSIPLGAESIRDCSNHPSGYRRSPALPQVAPRHVVGDQRSGRLLARQGDQGICGSRPSGSLLGGSGGTRDVFTGSLGYPSGHAAVAWAITLIVLAYVGRPWQIAAIVLAIVVPLVRLYVAAHLPLDLIGGAALGVTVASAVNLLFGVPILEPAEDTRPGQLDSTADARACRGPSRPRMTRDDPRSPISWSSFRSIRPMSSNEACGVHL